MKKIFKVAILCFFVFCIFSNTSKAEDGTNSTGLLIDHEGIMRIMGCILWRSDL